MVEIRKASREDAHLIASTRILVWRETYKGIYPDSLLNDYDIHVYALRDRDRISQSGENYYLFLDGEECIGYFSFGPYHYGSYKDFSLCLNHLYIRKHYQKMGLGRAAFGIVRDYCQEQGICKFFCGCNANNLPAVAFYRHMGGVQGDAPRSDVPKMDQILHFEFYLGDVL